MNVNNKQEMMCKEVTYFKELFHNFPVGTEENQRRHQ